MPKKFVFGMLDGLAIALAAVVFLLFFQFVLPRLSDSFQPPVRVPQEQVTVLAPPSGDYVLVEK